MTPAERDAFLAEPRVAVVAIADGDGPPLANPVWFDYVPGGLITLITARHSRKATAIRAAGELTLCVQAAEPPYRYVCVSGPVAKSRRASPRPNAGPSPAGTWAARAASATSPIAATLPRT
jgi:Pyridoxamine 5'-phosphate oxidase